MKAWTLHSEIILSIAIVNDLKMYSTVFASVAGSWWKIESDNGRTANGEEKKSFDWLLQTETVEKIS